MVFRFKHFLREWFIIFALSVGLLLLFVKETHAQFPFIQRKTWDGPYDIKMIAAPNLEPVYLEPVNAAAGRLKADSLIKYSTMLMSGTLLDINNCYKGGNPFVQLSGLPQQSVVCPDYNAPCMAGVPTTTPSSSCPVKYNNPTVLPDVYISMNYADYDKDLSTYSSSMAQLDISSCSEVEAAYLYWTGMFQGSNDAITLVTPTVSYNGSGNVFNTSTASGFETVRFKRPGGTYQNVTALPANIRNDGSRYLCVADVTTMVKGTGGGQFWVGNIQSYPNDSDGGSTSGWVLVVVFHSPLSPPRLISLWDGLQAISSGNSQNFVLTGLQAPATNNFKSYVGFAVLDGENLAAEIGSTAPEGLGFQTNNGGSFYSINPFQTDQPPYKSWTKKGLPATSSGAANLDACKKPLFDANWASVYDGISSSHITSYSDATGKNGNEIIRLPSNPNTLGLDAHHIKLPDGAVAPGATQATLTVNAGPQGGTTPFMAYIAIERLQPKLTMIKWADKNTTGLNSQITYTLRIRNDGNDKSLGGDMVYDTLDVATTYVGGSLTAISYKKGVPAAASVSLASSSGNVLQMNIAQSINPGDSLDLVFKVQVKDYTSAVNLWDVQCKRTITNTAYINYNTLSAGVLQSKSNANDCGIGAETKVLIFDAQLNGSTMVKLGPYNTSSYMTESVLSHVQAVLLNAGVAAADLAKYDVRDVLYNRVHPSDIFPYVYQMTYYAIRDYTGSGTCQQIYQIDFYLSVLPVEWVTFYGWERSGDVMLSWTTGSEKDNSYFVIERSTDGRSFIPVGTMPGKGNSNAGTTYVYDDTMSAGSLNYYRIKQLDINGTFSFSPIIAIHTREQTLDIFPNPNNGTFKITFSSGDSDYHLDIIDAEGRTVYVSSGNKVPGTLEVEGLARGLYIVRLFLDDAVVYKKLLVY